MSDTLTSSGSINCPPEPDNRTVNEYITKRISQLRERADEMESKLAQMPPELLDLRVCDLATLDIYI